MGFLDIFSGKSSENQNDTDLVIKGNKYYRSNRLNDALLAFNQALEFNPQNIEALCMKSVVLYDLEQFRESVDIVEKSLSLFNIELPKNSSDADWWAKKGESFLERKSYPQGLSFINTSLILNRENNETWYLKARLMYGYGNPDKAIECMHISIGYTAKKVAVYKAKYDSPQRTDVDRKLYIESTKQYDIMEEVLRRMMNKTWKE
jgi:tetratricopeptide (TPR) repeat protein